MSDLAVAALGGPLGATRRDAIEGPGAEALTASAWFAGPGGVTP